MSPYERALVDGVLAYDARRFREIDASQEEAWSKQVRACALLRMMVEDMLIALPVECRHVVQDCLEQYDRICQV